MKTLEERIEEALPEMRRQKKEWTMRDVLEELGLSQHSSNRTRVISTLKLLQERKKFEIEKEYWHGVGYLLKLK